MPDAKRVLNTILQARNDTPLVIFDLDSTLFDVSHRTQLIIEAFANESKFKKLYTDETTRLLSVRVASEDWGLSESLIKANFNPTKNFFKDLYNYWRKYFFSSRYLYADLPYKGAVEYVNELYNNGVKIFYLTGRDEKNMRSGTVKSLTHWKFPTNNLESILLMKPTKGSIKDDDFKSHMLLKLKHLSKHIWFFENEPIIIDKVRRSLPEIKVVWVDTTHSGRAQPPKNLTVIREYWFKS
ncbi:MAG: hypothetical protein A2Z20_11555 [Bdellovibrionales bacterium RBG_16_40_8]|nr:MAG: hypothetical protein A2Z20_11555 [Bdellovibrionales bacterium RBG_16_40_8]